MTSIPESGSLQPKLFRRSRAHRILVDEFVALYEYVGDDCVLYQRTGMSEKEFFGVCGDREPLFLLAAHGSSTWTVTNEGVVKVGPLTLESGHVVAVRLLIPAIEVKRRCVEQRPLTAKWRTESSRGTGVAAVPIRREVNVEERDRTGRTALMEAAAGGMEDIVAALLRAGANPNHRDNYAGTALIFASNSRNSGVVRLLLDAGADPESSNSSGDTALFVAVSEGDLNIVKMLVESGANPTVRNRLGHTPLWLAEQSGRTEIVSTLKKVMYEKKAGRGQRP